MGSHPTQAGSPSRESPKGFTTLLGEEEEEEEKRPLLHLLSIY